MFISPFSFFFFLPSEYLFIYSIRCIFALNPSETATRCDTVDFCDRSDCVRNERTASSEWKISSRSISSVQSQMQTLCNFVKQETAIITFRETHSFSLFGENAQGNPRLFRKATRVVFEGRVRSHFHRQRTIESEKSLVGRLKIFKLFCRNTYTSFKRYNLKLFIVVPLKTKVAKK